MKATTQTMEERLQKMELTLEHLSKLMESQVAWQSKFGELVEEMSPVAKEMMDSGIQELDQLERRGYFLFARDLAEALKRVVETYEPNSLPDLADSFGDVVLILRLLSQPKVLAAVQDLVEGFEQADSEPVGTLGAARRIEQEKDIQRGLGLALDLFGTLGRSVSRAPRLRTGRDLPRVTRPAAQTRPTQVSKESPATPANIQELQFVPAAEWNKEWASEMAESLGVAPLTDEKWRIIEFARKEYVETENAPNIRRITKALEVSTRDVYTLFPSAPGPTISQLAGVPKPAGCL